MNEKELGFLEKQFKQLGLKEEFTLDLKEELAFHQCVKSIGGHKD